MITRIQALNYRCLRYVDVALDRFHLLVGPNASGKSTLFDAISFVGDFIRDGLDEAVAKRTYNFQDLVWGRPTEDLGFELALDVAIPSELRPLRPDGESFHAYRYEIAVREVEGVPRVVCERGTLVAGRSAAALSRNVRRSFPRPPRPPKTILAKGGRDDSLLVLERDLDGLKIAVEERMPDETQGRAPVRMMAGQTLVDPTVSHLRFLDESRSPVSTYVYALLSSGVNSVFLDSGAMREPSRFNNKRNPLALRGARLPWTMKDILENDRDLYDAWLSHVQMELEDLEDVRVVYRPEDRSHYLMLKYGTGVEIPSWMVSDGTLRFLALMLAAYMAREHQVYLLDEPENGVHLSALEAIYDATSTAGAAQILFATHSPALLSRADPEEVICCARNNEGETDIVQGHRHPLVRDWQGPINMTVFFSKGTFE